VDFGLQSLLKLLFLLSRRPAGISADRSPKSVRVQTTGVHQTNTALLEIWDLVAGCINGNVFGSAASGGDFDFNKTHCTGDLPGGCGIIFEVKP
jgi:hypothetical protein